MTALKRPSRSKAETIRRLRAGDLRQLVQARCGHNLPEDDAGREYLWEWLLIGSLGAEPERKMLNIVETFAPWMDSAEAFQVISQIGRIPRHERWRTARKLGELLNVPHQEREAFKLWQFRPCDMTDKQMKELKKAKKRTGMQRLRRRSGTKSREAYLADNSLARRKPWQTEGISRATWFRNHIKIESNETGVWKEQKSDETSVWSIKTLISCPQTSLTEQAGESESGWARRFRFFWW